MQTAAVCPFKEQNGLSELFPLPPALSLVHKALVTFRAQTLAQSPAAPLLAGLLLLPPGEAAL